MKKDFRSREKLCWVAVVFLLTMSLTLGLFGCGGGGNGGTGTGGGGNGGTGNGGGTGNLVRLHVRRNNQPVNFPWAAYQDGTGAWQRLTPTTTGEYQFTVTDSQGRYGVAWVEDESGYVTLRQFTLQDANELWIPLEPEDVNTYTVSGQATNAQGPFAVAVDGQMELFELVGNYALDEVPPGTWDLLAATVTQQGGETGWVGWVTRVYVHRNLAVTSNVAHNINFNNARPVQMFSVSASGSEWSVVAFVTKNGTTAPLAIAEGSPASSFQAPAVPSDLTQSGDLYVALAMSETRNTMTWKVFSTPQNTTLSLPNPLTGVGGSYPTVTGLSSGVQLWVFSLEYQDKDWSVMVSKRWLGNATSYTVPADALASVSGWQSAWSLPSTGVNVFVDAVTTNTPLSLFFSPQVREVPIAGEFDIPIITSGMEIKVASTYIEGWRKRGKFLQSLRKPALLK